MITFKSNGDFSKANKALEKMLEVVHLGQLDKYGRMGVDALRSSTPIDSGKTADSWEYEIKRSGGRVELSFNNTNVNKGVNIAIILQYGHGTGTGGYVQGRDYINPAVQPVFDDIVQSATKELSII